MKRFSILNEVFPEGWKKIYKPKNVKRPHCKVSNCVFLANELTVSRSHILEKYFLRRNTIANNSPERASERRNAVHHISVVDRVGFHNYPAIRYGSTFPRCCYCCLESNFGNFFLSGDSSNPIAKPSRRFVFNSFLCSVLMNMQWCREDCLCRFRKKRHKLKLIGAELHRICLSERRIFFSPIACGVYKNI